MKTHALPTVTICTLTYNRPSRLGNLQQCIEAQDYPLKLIEWLILDDSNSYTGKLNFSTKTDLRIKYQRINKKLILGQKRNLSHRLCSGEVIVYMDDDDYYYPTRVSHAVSTLETTGLSFLESIRHDLLGLDNSNRHHPCKQLPRRCIVCGRDCVFAPKLISC